MSPEPQAALETVWHERSGWQESASSNDSLIVILFIQELSLPQWLLGWKAASTWPPGPSGGRSLPAEGVLPYGPSTHWESPKHTSHELDSPTPCHMRVAPSRTDSTILRWTAPKGARRHEDKPQTKDQETWDRVHYLHEFGQFLHLCRPRFPQSTTKRWIGQKFLDQDPWGPQICTGNVIGRCMFLVMGFSRQSVTSPNLRAIAGASVQPRMCLKCSWLYQTSRWDSCLKSPDFVLWSNL